MHLDFKVLPAAQQGYSWLYACSTTTRQVLLSLNTYDKYEHPLNIVAPTMRGNQIGKDKVLLATSLLSCLLIFSLLPTVLSLEAGMRKLSSSGSVAYDNLMATLLVTDSTPEGPIPYEIDGNAGYQTGSTYTISAEVHVIELPSPYTSPISDLTYYFSYWQDGPTDNPRTITFDASSTIELHVVYSTPPPSPPANITMPPDYLAYWGESSSILSQPPRYDDGGVGGWWVSWGSGDNVWRETSIVHKGTYSLGLWNGGYPSDSGRLAKTTSRGSSGIWGYPGDVYQSYWIYMDEHTAGTWNQFWELREFDSRSGKWGIADSATSIFLGASSGTSENLYWRFIKGHTGTSPQNRASFKCYVYDDSIYWQVHPSNLNPSFNEATDCIINPHRVPFNTWFRLEVFHHRGSNHDGIFTVWITDPNNPDPLKRDTRILFHIENVDTSDTAHNPSLQNWEPADLKLYGMEMRVYFDEIYWYNYNIRGG